jgi:ribose transport system permease protein
MSKLDRPATARSVQGNWVSGLGEWAAVPAATLVLVVVGALLSPRFLTTGNFLNVLTSMSLVGIIAVGMAFVMISGGLADLSVPATVATGAILVLGAQPLVGTVGAVLVALVAAGLTGLVNGLLIGYSRANPIIVTLGVGTIALGVVQAFVGGVLVYGSDPSAGELVNANLFGVPVVLIIFALVALVAHVLLSRTSWGRWTYAVGGNYSAAEASAVPVRRVKAGAFVLTALLAALSGCLLGLSLQVARPLVGVGYEFDAITAVVVGGVSLLGGSGSIPRAVLGVFFVQAREGLAHRVRRRR